MKYIKVSLSTKKEARKMFESGYDMIDIASSLNINLGTLYNLSSKEGWVKGSRQELLRVIETSEELENLVEIRKAIIEKYRDISSGIKHIKIQMIETALGDGTLPKARAEAIEKLAGAMAKTYAVDKELYSIMTPKEEIELASERVKYEDLKRKLFNNEEETDEHVVV
ncbi:MAG: hypothetical protein ACRCU6_00210 [Fusobacteriaceae bacterium]